MLKQIDKMHYQYGFGDGFCHECPHFKRKCWNKKCEKRVTGYAQDGTEIVEYESYIACGLIDKDFPDDTIPGQIAMELGGDQQ